MSFLLLMSARSQSRQNLASSYSGLARSTDCEFSKKLKLNRQPQLCQVYPLRERGRSGGLRRRSEDVHGHRRGQN